MLLPCCGGAGGGVEKQAKIARRRTGSSRPCPALECPLRSVYGSCLPPILMLRAPVPIGAVSCLVLAPGMPIVRLARESTHLFVILKQGVSLLSEKHLVIIEWHLMELVILCRFHQQETLISL